MILYISPYYTTPHIPHYTSLYYATLYLTVLQPTPHHTTLRPTLPVDRGQSSLKDEIPHQGAGPERDIPRPLLHPKAVRHVECRGHGADREREVARIDALGDARREGRKERGKKGNCPHCIYSHTHSPPPPRPPVQRSCLQLSSSLSACPVPSRPLHFSP